MNSRSLPVSSLVFLAVVYVITLFALETKGLWTTDNANKFIQVQAILKSDFASLAIPWPGASIDPGFAYNPLPYHFSEIRDGEMYGVSSPIFAGLSALLFAGLGFSGLYLLPLICSLAMLAGVARIAGILHASHSVKHLAVLLTGLCTPVWFYSVVFWEHTVAACLCIWALFYFLEFLQAGSRGQLIRGSLVAALGVYFLADLYLLLLVLVVSAAFWSRERCPQVVWVCVATMVVCLLPLWLFQWKSVGQPFGLYFASFATATSSLGDHLVGRPGVFLNLFLRSSPSLLVSLIVSAPFLIVWLVRPRYTNRAFGMAIPVFGVVALAAALVSLGGYLFSQSPIAYMLNSANSLFTVAPVVALGFLRQRNSGTEGESPLGRWLWMVTIGYGALYGLGTPEFGTVGIYWGNCFLLMDYPIWILLASVNLVEWWQGQGQKSGWAILGVVLVVLVSFGAQLYSLQVLGKKKSFTHELNEFVGQRPEQVILSNERWVPQELYTQFFDKLIYHVPKPEMLSRLTQTLMGRGHREYLLLTQLPIPSVGRVRHIAEFRDRELDYFDLNAYVVSAE